MRKLLLLGTLFLVFGFSEKAYSQVIEFKGFVKTSDGKPIKDVYLQGFGKTDENGYFRIASDVLVRFWKTIIFDKRGFVPRVVVLDASNTNLEIILKEETENNIWEIPNCSGNKPKQSKLVGKYLKLTVPKSTKIKSGSDTDYTYTSIEFGKEKQKSWLRSGLGNLYGGIYPSGEKLLELKHYTYRRTAFGIDWRGITKEGNYWRYFGSISLFETYHYETNAQEAATFFDNVLDTMCYEPEEPRK